MKIYQQGDRIEWTFTIGEDPSGLLEKFRPLEGKKFQAEIAHVDMKEKCYMVVAKYGPDGIPFNKATLIKEKSKGMSIGM